MARYRYGSRQPAKSAPKVIARDLLIDPATPRYICYAMHSIPSDELLATRNQWDFAKFTPSWAKRQLNQVQDQQSCIAYFTKRNIALLPLPLEVKSSDVPYAIAYDFYHPIEKDWLPVARYYGFVVLTMPAHDWRRSVSYATSNNLPAAMLHADRALLNLASLRDATSIAQIEKPYLRYEKLRDLFIDQAGLPEGDLAGSMALRQAEKCYNFLCTAQ